MRAIARAATLVSAVFLLGLSCNGESPTALETLIEFALRGQNQVPPVDTSATGRASFTLNDATIEFRIEVQNINQVTAAHLHRGAQGENGPIAVTLYDGPTTGAVNGVLVQGTITANDIQGMTLEQLKNGLRKGCLYVNVHTVAHPTGELRGQLASQDCGTPDMPTY